MRQYKEVIRQVLDFAMEDELVRVVMLNGSRVNVNAPVDIFQDYDIVFFVRDIDRCIYKENRDWIKRFGELVILQQNDFEDGSYIFLMQFKDIRIDLRICDLDTINDVIVEDTLSKILLDKDNIVLSLTEPSDTIHWVKKPSKAEWDKLFNEAWWIQTYIAKGIWRDELPLVKYMYDVILMACVGKMVSWHIAIDHDWQVNTGKCGKWFKKYLDTELYEQYVALYPSTSYDEIWESLYYTGVFIRKIGINLSEKLGYTYPLVEDKNVTEYISMIKGLSLDATQLF